MASSVIRSAHYEPRTSELDIEFFSGRVYRYIEVPRAVAEALARGPSLGHVFNAVIRDHLPAAGCAEKHGPDPIRNGKSAFSMTFMRNRLFGRNV